MAPNWVQTLGFRGRSWSLESALNLEETPSVLSRQHVEVLDGSDCKEMVNPVHTDGPESSHISVTERNSSSQQGRSLPPESCCSVEAAGSGSGSGLGWSGSVT